VSLARAARQVIPNGRTHPRIGPPVPARTALAGFEAAATDLGFTLLPWQREAARYLTALGVKDRLLYREIAIVVARQSGKTFLLAPLIVSRLRAGGRIMHTAQNRVLPREVFDIVADHMTSHHPDELVRKPRYANGQEEVRTLIGGHYRIVAPSRGGARGPANDLVIIDELREMETFDFIAAAKPTLTASASPQFLYLSNAGEESSVVLNALRARRDDDPNLAYLEWSAAPERRADDVRGWAESNPALGHRPEVAETLRAEYRTAVLQDTLALFEVEHLCRWVNSTKPPLVDEGDWMRCHGETGPTRRPMLAVSMDPSGDRASAVLAWRLDDGAVALQVIADVTGDPIDVDRFGPDLRILAGRLGVREVGFAPWTDAALAREFPNAKPLDGRAWANASGAFSMLVEAGRIRWQDADQVTKDLGWTTRKPHESGAWQAVKARDNRPITAALAAVRAVWLASGPRAAAPKVM
jgi:hypothetical protein